MKKFLVIAMMMLFAASAFAVESKIYGYHELEGRFVANNNAAKDSKQVSNLANYYQHLRIWAELSIDDKATVTMRFNPVNDYIWGAGNISNGANDGNLGFDRAWIDYKVLDNLIVSGGRMHTNTDPLYTGKWGSVHVPFGAGTMGADQLQVVFIPQDNIVLGAVAIKVTENTVGTNGRENIFNQKGNSGDLDIYILLAQLQFGEITLRPSFSLNNGEVATFLGNNALKDRHFTRITAYLGGEFDNDMLNVKAAFGYQTATLDKKKGEDTQKKLDASSMGFFAEGTFKGGIFNAGLTFAYSSYEKMKDKKLDNLNYYYFGKDFDRTVIVDDKLFNATGVPAMMTIQAFGDVTPMDDLTFALRVAYYMSNVDGKMSDADGADDATIGADGMLGGGVIGKDTTFLEIDAAAVYQWTDSTAITLAAAYLMANDIGPKSGKKDAEPIYAVLWNVKTTF